MSMPNQAVAPSNAQNLTLGDINRMLGDAGFPAITGEKVQALQEIEPRQRIIRAVQLAKTDPAAQQFLANLFKTAGIHPDNTNQAPSNQPVPNNNYAPAPSQAPQQQSSAPANIADHSRYNQRQPNPRDYAPDNAGADQKSPSLSPEERISHHVYGGKAALCFEADMTKQGVYTIALDAAASTAPRQYNWGEKVRIQLTRAELPIVAAVFLGMRANCKFDSHGHDNSKGFSMERQNGNKIFTKVFARDQGVKAVPIEGPDAFHIASILVKQIQKSHPWLDSTSIMGMIRATCSG